MLLDAVLGPVTDGTRGAIVKVLRAWADQDYADDTNELSPLEVCSQIVALFDADIAARRAKIENPKTPEERVTTRNKVAGYATDELRVGNPTRLYLDDEELPYFRVVEYARLGLIAQLKEQA